MKLQTKFNVGEKVYQTRYEDEPDIKEITRIIIDSMGVGYELDNESALYNENELLKK
jgi:hypothetical protein